MPYQKKKYKYKRPGYKACGKMVYADAAKALAIARGVKRLLNVEIKNHDVQQLGIGLTTAPVITQLSNIIQGDTTITRDGSQCKMLGINLNYFIQLGPSGIVTVVRIMLVLDKQTNQAIYLNTDLLEDVTVGDNILSPRNLDNLHRFTILYDQTHNISTARSVVVVKKYIRKEVILRYDASGNDIADLTQNSISLVQMTNVTSAQPLISSFLRLRYVDN